MGVVTMHFLTKDKTMTRGTLAIILDDCILQSFEFNGSMWYRKGEKDFGHDAVRALKNVKDSETFKDAIIKFNDSHHKYDIERDLNNKITYVFDLDILDFNKKYFENWFSDYVYIKNCTDKDIDIVEKDSKKVFCIGPNKVFVLNFGEVIKC